jgi:hypothetical protein
VCAELPALCRTVRDHYGNTRRPSHAVTRCRELWHRFFHECEPESDPARRTAQCQVAVTAAGVHRSLGLCHVVVSWCGPRAARSCRAPAPRTARRNHLAPAHCSHRAGSHARPPIIRRTS